MSSSDSQELYAVADFCLIPMGFGTDPSVGPQIAECQRVLEKSGLEYNVSLTRIHINQFRYVPTDPNDSLYQLHGYGTNIEGPWSKVMDAIRDCHAAVHKMGVPRIAVRSPPPI